MAERHPSPAVIESDVRSRVLRRVPLNAPLFDEGGLQEVLRKHPSVLPLGEDERFSPAVPVAREACLGPGCYLDNLYASPAGYVTLVETKLWKNAEARREVVAQSIEYAMRLWQ